MVYNTKIPLFRRWVLQNFPFIEQDFDALTDYQLICKVVEYLNKCIETVNASTEQIELLTNTVNQLQEYLDNLDLQEEVNNKLEEMAEDGTLADLVANVAFQSLKINDNYDIDYERHVDSSFPLIYHTTKISPVEGKTTSVQLKGKLCSYDLNSSSLDENAITMFNYAERGTNFLVGSNCDSAGSLAHAVYIRDGEVLRSESDRTNETVWGITEDGVMKIYKNALTTTDLVNDKIQNSWGCSCLFYNGSKDTTTWAAAGSDITEVKHPRTIVLQEADTLSIILLHIEGRNPNSVGVTFNEACDLIESIYPNVYNAVIMGGGGDTQLMIDGEIKNDCSDNQLRNLYDFMYLDGNLDYSVYNDASLEIANARNVSPTLSQFLKTHVSLKDNHLYANKMINVSVGEATDSALKLVGNIGYNVSLDNDEVVILKFPDLSSYDWNITVGLNIHYDTKTFSPNIQHQDGTTAQPMEISNKILYAYWNGSHYILIDNSVIEHTSGNVEKDLDNFKTSGEYYSENFTNMPSTQAQSTSRGLLKVSYLPNNDIVQVYQTVPTNIIYVRTFTNNAWTSWNCFEGNNPVAKNGLNADNCVGLLYHFYGNNISNRPASTNNGWLINLPGNTGYNFQIFLERATGENSNRVYVRAQENGTFADWKQLAFVS